MEDLTSMNHTMQERGPDDAGVECVSLPCGWTLGMAQRRLSILDLSPLGHQPMSTPDGRVILVYNGEIYNFKEIRKSLPAYPYRSQCDTEVILAAYLAWGKDCFSHFNGMFAIALYDQDNGELILSRDREGQKPLYYWEDGDNLVFASVLAPIMTCPGFHENVRRDVLPRYIYQDYIEAPDTIFEHVYKVEPGTCLVFHVRGAARQNEKETISKESETRILRWFDNAKLYQTMQEDPIDNLDEAKEQLLACLRSSVRQRMISDVPLGTFLSGGYDSSLVSALAAEELRAQGSNERLKTFSIGFKEKEYDESSYALSVAKHLGTDHTTLTVNENDMLELVSELPLTFDEPMSDSSEISTMLVSRLARKSVTVALTGDAGDELFCGYSLYDMVRKAQKLDSLGAIAHTVGQIPLGKGRTLEDKYPFKVRTISANRNPKTKAQFGEGNYIKTAREMVLPPEQKDWENKAYPEGHDPSGFLSVNYETEDQYPSSNWQIRRMLLDLDTYLPGDILAKVDRASMRYSLESRCPFLDPQVIACSFRIDHSLKYHKKQNAKGWEKKFILKQIAYDYIPEDLLNRPKKGFSVPLSSWLRGPLRSQLLRYSRVPFLKEQRIFCAEKTADVVSSFLAQGDAGSGTGNNYSRIVWSFFVFQQWAEYWNVGV